METFKEKVGLRQSFELPATPGTKKREYSTKCRTEQLKLCKDLHRQMQQGALAPEAYLGHKDLLLVATTQPAADESLEDLQASLSFLQALHTAGCISEAELQWSRVTILCRLPSEDTGNQKPVEDLPEPSEEWGARIQNAGAAHNSPLRQAVGGFFRKVRNSPPPRPGAPILWQSGSSRSLKTTPRRSFLSSPLKPSRTCPPHYPRPNSSPVSRRSDSPPVRQLFSVARRARSCTPEPLEVLVLDNNMENRRELSGRKSSKQGEEVSQDKRAFKPKDSLETSEKGRNANRSETQAAHSHFTDRGSEILSALSSKLKATKKRSQKWAARFRNFKGRPSLGTREEGTVDNCTRSGSCPVPYFCAETDICIPSNSCTGVSDSCQAVASCKDTPVLKTAKRSPTKGYRGKRPAELAVARRGGGEITATSSLSILTPSNHNSSPPSAPPFCTPPSTPSTETWTSVYIKGSPYDGSPVSLKGLSTALRKMETVRYSNENVLEDAVKVQNSSCANSPVKSAGQVGPFTHFR